MINIDEYHSCNSNNNGSFVVTSLFDAIIFELKVRIFLILDSSIATLNKQRVQVHATNLSNDISGGFIRHTWNGTGKFDELVVWFR